MLPQSEKTSLDEFITDQSHRCISTSKNKFVHLALQSTIAVAAEITGLASITRTLASGIEITVVGDNDFYSQREKVWVVMFTAHDGHPDSTQLASLNLPRTLASLSEIPPFTPTGVSLSNVHKTGLGSSAALITSLVSALLVHFSCIERSALVRGSEVQSEGRLLAHNLSQYVHCLAQGKVGSGFDVAAAVFGSHLYTRFGPGVLQGLMGDDVVSLWGVLSFSVYVLLTRLCSSDLDPSSRSSCRPIKNGTTAWNRSSCHR